MSIITEIGEGKYNLPITMSEITTKVGFALNKLIEEDFKNDLDNIEFKKWMLSILLSTDYDIVNQVVDENIKNIINNHCFFQSYKMFVSKYIVLNKKIYELREYQEDTDIGDIMTVNNYVELDNLLEKYYDNYDKLFSYLYKPLKLSFFKRLKIRFKIKKYKNIDDIPYIIWQSAIYNLINHKKYLLNNYNLGIKDKNISDDQQDDQIKLNNIEKEFGLYNSLMLVSNNDIQLVKLWLTQDVREFFYYLHYLRVVGKQQ